MELGTWRGWLQGAFYELVGGGYDWVLIWTRWGGGLISNIMIFVAINISMIPAPAQASKCCITPQ